MGMEDFTRHQQGVIKRYYSNEGGIQLQRLAELVTELFLAEGCAVSQSLSRSQAIVLGLVVVLALGMTGVGLAQIATKQGLWADSCEVTVGFPDANDVAPGTPVRVRGVD